MALNVSKYHLVKYILDTVPVPADADADADAYLEVAKQWFKSIKRIFKGKRLPQNLMDGLAHKGITAITSMVKAHETDVYTVYIEKEIDRTLWIERRDQGNLKAAAAAASKLRLKQTS
jgi:hypothetical protein